MHLCIKLTNWFFFLPIYWGSCPQSWRLVCSRPTILVLSSFPNIIINKLKQISYYSSSLWPHSNITLYPDPHALFEILGFLLFSNAPCQRIKQICTVLNKTCSWYVVVLRYLDSTSPCSYFQFSSIFNLIRDILRFSILYHLVHNWQGMVHHHLHDWHCARPIQEVLVGCSLSCASK